MAGVGSSILDTVSNSSVVMVQVSAMVLAARELPAVVSSDVVVVGVWLLLC